MKIIQLIIFPVFIILFYYLVTNISDNLDNTEHKNSKYCTELEYKDSLILHPKNFSNFNIDIEFFSEKKWKERLLKDEIQGRKNKEISGYHTHFYTLKNRNKAIIYFSISGKLECKLIGNIRPHGDFSDHREGNDLPSLNVNLKKGHIFGITKFILFRPVTRNNENEIVVTSLLSELNFLAPRSTFVNVKHKKKIKKFIFQERIEKEFLEQNSLREGPLYQGDERFIWWDPYETLNLSRHKLRNPNWAIKSNSNVSISEHGLSILNQFNQYFKIEVTHNVAVDYYSLGKKINKKYFKNLHVFDSLLYALEAEHGVGRDDRRFYFDAVNETFKPIYYDGMSNVLVKNQINQSPFESEENLNLLNKTFLKTARVIPSSVEGADEALDLIKKLNVKKLTDKLNSRGVIFSLKKVEDLKKNVIFNLENLKNFNSKRIYVVSAELNRNSFMKKEDNFNRNFPRRFVYYGKDFSEFLNCDLFGSNCKKLTIDNTQKTKLISQELLDENNNSLVYVGKKKTTSVQSGWHSDDFQKIKKTYFKIDNDFSFYTIGRIDHEIDKILKTITFKKKNILSKIIFLNGYLKDWKIIFKNDLSENKKNFLKMDLNGVSGCLNFIDMKIQGAIIEIEDSNCEDAVNFIRTNGTIKFLKILNSKHDSVDADFSNIEFNKIEIFRSGNDCLDFSYGEYTVKNALVKFCGDKAVSAGEGSVLEIQDSNFFQSNIGVASKDYARVNIFRSKIENSEYCFQSYNKKQEFSGASLIIIDSKCEKSNNIFYKDNVSELRIK